MTHCATLFTNNINFGSVVAFHFVHPQRKSSQSIMSPLPSQARSLPPRHFRLSWFRIERQNGLTKDGKSQPGRVWQTEKTETSIWQANRTEFCGKIHTYTYTCNIQLQWKTTDSQFKKEGRPDLVCFVCVTQKMKKVSSERLSVGAEEMNRVGVQQNHSQLNIQFGFVSNFSAPSSELSQQLMHKCTDSKFFPQLSRVGQTVESLSIIGIYYVGIESSHINWHRPEQPERICLDSIHEDETISFYPKGFIHYKTL